ncbi:YqcI/YcgG family protein [Priestia megaterium]|nr:YqcI/YcgG family protein [Priestia megaterium]
MKNRHAPDKREWKQYVITDDNESIKSKCPFHAQFNEKNII